MFVNIHEKLQKFFVIKPKLATLPCQRMFSRDIEKLKNWSPISSEISMSKGTQRKLYSTGHWLALGAPGFALGAPRSALVLPGFALAVWIPKCWYLQREMVVFGV